MQMQMQMQMQMGNWGGQDALHKGIGLVIMTIHPVASNYDHCLWFLSFLCPHPHPRLLWLWLWAVYSSSTAIVVIIQRCNFHLVQLVVVVHPSSDLCRNPLPPKTSIGRQKEPSSSPTNQSFSSSSSNGSIAALFSFVLWTVIGTMDLGYWSTSTRTSTSQRKNLKFAFTWTLPP